MEALLHPSRLYQRNSPFRLHTCSKSPHFYLSPSNTPTAQGTVQPQEALGGAEPQRLHRYLHGGHGGLTGTWGASRPRIWKPVPSATGVCTLLRMELAAGSPLPDTHFHFSTLFHLGFFLILHSSLHLGHLTLHAYRYVVQCEQCP